MPYIHGCTNDRNDFEINFGPLRGTVIWPDCPYDKITVYSSSFPHNGFIDKCKRLRPNNRVIYRQRPPDGKNWQYWRWAYVGGITVQWGPRHMKMPRTIISVNPWELGLSPEDLVSLIGLIVPLNSAEISGVECKLDISGVESNSLANLVLVDKVRRVEPYVDKKTGIPTDTWYFGGKTSPRPLTVYNKSKEQGIQDAIITRIERRLKLSLEERPPLIDFITGINRPQTPFEHVRIVNLEIVDGRTARIFKRLDIINGLKYYAETHSKRDTKKLKAALRKSAIEVNQIWDQVARAWHEGGRSQTGVARRSA